MKFRSILAVVPLTLVVISCGTEASADAQAQANKLFVEAVLIWKQYQAEPRNGSDTYQIQLDIRMLKEARADLAKIISAYPESSLAVDLAATGEAKGLAMADVDAAIAGLQAQLAKPASPRTSASATTPAGCDAAQGGADSADCIFADAVKSLRAIKGDTDLRGLTLSYVGEVQAKAGDFAGAYATAESIKGAGLRTEGLTVTAAATAASPRAKTGDVDGARVMFDEARKSAQDNEDARWREWDLEFLASAQLKIGDVAAARATLGDALKAAQETKDIETLSSVVQALAKAGDLASALRTAQGMHSSRDRDDALKAVALAQAKAGDFAGTLKTQRGIKGFDARNEIQVAVASAQAKAGDVASALETALGIEDDASRAEALASVARAQAKAGDDAAARATLARALKTAQGLGGGYWQAQALASVVSAQVELGDIAGARATLASALKSALDVKDAGSRGEALQDVALAQARAGDNAAARATLADAYEAMRAVNNDYGTRDQLLASLASAQAKIGDISGALKSTLDIESQGRDEALKTVASMQAKPGDVARAQAFALLVEDAELRAEALASLAPVRAKAGDVSAAHATLAHALKTAKAIEDDGSRSNALYYVALNAAALLNGG